MRPDMDLVDWLERRIAREVVRYRANPRKYLGRLPGRAQRHFAKTGRKRLLSRAVLMDRFQIAFQYMEPEPSTSSYPCGRADA